MRLGFSLPQLGPLAGPDAVEQVAQSAEQLGYDSLWVLDRLLRPLNPQVPYPAAADGILPFKYSRVLDPLDTLTFAAAKTQHMAAFTPPAIERAAREADGWFPVGIPLSAVGPMFEQIRGAAAKAAPGRQFELIVRGNVEFADLPVASNRADFTGTLDQVAGDIAAARKLGAHELVFDVQFSKDVESIDSMLRSMKDLKAAAG